MQRYAKKTYPYIVFNNYYCSNAYLFKKESVTLHLTHNNNITNEKET